MGQIMNTFKISRYAQDVTILPNAFLDGYMPHANGEFVKIYLYLLRVSQDPAKSVSLSQIADRMACTENDVVRAVRYWEKTGLLIVETDEKRNIAGITFADPLKSKEEAVREKSSRNSQSGSSSESAAGAEKTAKSEEPYTLTEDKMTELAGKEDVQELLFIAEKYMSRPLTRTDQQKIFYFLDGLRFSTDLVDYLIEYCVSRGHKSIRYIEKVALAWHDAGIKTVTEARESTGKYHKEYYDIFKALGVNNHNPITAEIRIMDKWLVTYGFPMDVITEACTRTILNTSKPTLGYADGILTNWWNTGVKTMNDIKAQDARREKGKGSGNARSGQSKKSRTPSGSFYNFEQRNYDYQSLEAQLLNMDAISGDGQE
jgi:DnaD/phage-associated family protein